MTLKKWFLQNKSANNNDNTNTTTSTTTTTTTTTNNNNNNNNNNRIKKYITIKSRYVSLDNIETMTDHRQELSKKFKISGFYHRLFLLV